MSTTPKEIKQSLNKFVVWNSRSGCASGGKYKLVGVMFRRDEKKGNFFYQAHLEDRFRNLIVVRLDEIEQINER